MSDTRNIAHRWLWYNQETDQCAPLDADAYASMEYGRRTVPLAPFTCIAPDGGYHVDDRILGLDLAVIGLPATDEEFSWTCEYGVSLIADGWLSEIKDLIDPGRIGLGRLRMNGVVIDGWSTIHERQPPQLLSTEGSSKSCPICGHSYSALHGREYFEDRAVLGRPLIVNSNGLFVREDIALTRKLRTPRGAFEPGVVAFERPGSTH